MNLDSLISYLSKHPHDKPVPLGFGNPHSYRGYYDELAFEPVKNTTIGAMLEAAQSADGETYEGYKGGEYQMRGYTECWLAEYGCCGEGIGPVLLAYMVGELPDPPKEGE